MQKAPYDDTNTGSCFIFFKVYNNTEYVYLLSNGHGFDSLPGCTSSALMHINLKFALHK